MDPSISQYIHQLNEKEQIAHSIAICLLESSYNLEKSNGYLNFIKNKK